MKTDITQTAAAPSATTATAATAATAAAAPTPLTSLADFAEAARKSIAREDTQAAATAAKPAEAAATAGQESPPEDAEAAAAAEAEAQAAAELAQTAEADPNAATEATTETEEAAEPTAEEQAAMTDSERRIHGALQKERQKSKDARAENRKLQERLEALESKLTDKPKPADAATAKPGEEQSQATTAAPSAGESPLSHCITFEAVDAAVTVAATTESQVVRLQNRLARGGVEAVAPDLKALGVTIVNGMPVAEADANVIGDFLDSVFAGAKATQAAAAPQKALIVSQQHSWREAAKVMPEINDVKSETHRMVTAALQQFPALKANPNWPLIVAKQIMGEQAFTAKAKPAAAAAAKPAAQRVVKAAPGAPRRSAAAIPQTTAQEGIRTKIANGTATMAEVQEYTRANIGAGAS